MRLSLESIVREVKAQQRTQRTVASALAGSKSGASGARSGGSGGGKPESPLVDLPQHLQGHCSAARISRGTLTLQVPHAAAMHALSAWLRGGGEAQLRSRHATIQRVKVQVSKA